jgi:preprotein translocase subunit SecY
MMVRPDRGSNLIQNALTALKVPDLQRRFKFLLFALAVYAFGAHIPVPGIDTSGIERFFTQGAGAGPFFGLINMFTGGALRKFSIFALGVIPYINGSIIVQLLTAAFPQLEEWRKEGEWGRRKLARLTRYLTLLSAALQGFGYLHLFMNTPLPGGGTVLPQDLSIWQQIWAVLSMIAGTAFLMWLGELITERGIGNGISIIIFAGIVLRLPGELAGVISSAISGGVPWGSVLLLFALFGFTLFFIVYVQQSQRRIPVTYTRRMVGNRIGSVTSYLPVPVNIGGVIPIIFALAVVSFPVTLVSFFPVKFTIPFVGWTVDMIQVRSVIQHWFTPGGSWFGLLLYGVMVIIFTYFYAAIIYRPDEIADNLRKWGGVIPGIRPGQQTVEYIDRVATRITFAGAIFLAIVAVLEFLVPAWTRIPESQFSLVGGTSILIAVSVALETMKQLEAQLLLRQYETFIK